MSNKYTSVYFLTQEGRTKLTVKEKTREVKLKQ